MNRLLYILAFILLGTSAQAQWQPTTRNYQKWYQFEFKMQADSLYAGSAFYAPVRDTTWTPTQIGAIVYKSTNSKLYVCTALTGQKWTEIGSTYSNGYGLVLASNTFRADTFALATRDRVGVMIDSAKTSVPVPTLQQVLTAGNTATLNATTTATLTGAMVQSTDGQAYITNSSGFGTAGFRDADGIIQTQITGFTDSSSNGRGKINTSVFTFKPMTNRLPNGASTSGYANLYYRAGAFRVSVDGVETDLGSGGASVSETPYTVTYSATPTFDYDNGVNQEITLTGNITGVTFSDIPDGKTMYILLKQDATGSRTLAGLPAGSKVINSGAGAVTLSTAGSSWDLLGVKRWGSSYLITYGKDFD